jgi:hypothetical protein
MIQDEQFFAWLDGELGPEEAAEVGRQVAADPGLQHRAEEHRQLAGTLRDAFGSVADAPLPERFLPRKAEVIDLASRRPVSRSMQWLAMAATLAIGFAAGTTINAGGSGPIGRENGQLVASGELERALYTRLASAPADQGARIGLTFRDARGDICRSFTDEGSAGLACHQGGDWRIRGLFQAGEGQSGAYRMAAGPDPRLADLIDATMAGAPLDAAGERQALDGLR